MDTQSKCWFCDFRVEEANVLAPEQLRIHSLSSHPVQTLLLDQLVSPPEEIKTETDPDQSEPIKVSALGVKVESGITTDAGESAERGLGRRESNREAVAGGSKVIARGGDEIRGGGKRRKTGGRQPQNQLLGIEIAESIQSELDTDIHRCIQP